jgi:pimeloyl-ACP methyl ester carboxylesterase
MTPTDEKGGKQLTTITTKDGTQIYYKDWGTGQPVVFSHGWPLSADSWEPQMVFLASNGYRCIAHDRSGHGRSSQPWSGNDMDTYADDLATLIETLALKDAVVIGFSAGGGEVARYIGRHGAKRLAKAALISAVPPLMLKTATNPGGLPIKVCRRPPRRFPSRPLAALQGSRRRPVLRSQQARRQGLAGRDGLVLASGDAGRSQEHLRLHQGILRDGLH